MEVVNASTKPRVYYGLHFCEGVAEYRPTGSDPYRLLINNDTATQMDASFAGLPVYVGHVEDVDLSKVENEAAGYVVESFYNPVDGKHWVKFLVVSDRGHRALQNGWKLSNAYRPTTFGPGGEWHGVPYKNEVLNAEYTHLALVQDPRYAESIILTPSEFKQYNADKELALTKIANSKDASPPGALATMFNFFTKSKVDKSEELANTSVMLKTGVEKTIGQLINDAEERERGMAHPEDKVQVGDRTMTVNELRDAHMSLCKEKQDSADKVAADDAEKKKAEEQNAADAKAKADADALATKAKADSDAAAAKAEADRVQQNAKEKAEFHAQANAEAVATARLTKVPFSSDALARGRDRYGSN